MSKLLPAILVTLMITGMSIFSVFQSNTIQDQGHTIEEQGKEIDFLEVSLQTEEEENAILAMDNTLLRETILVLRDSVSFLQGKIKGLKATVRKQAKTIKSIKAKLKDIENQYESLKMEIADLARKDEIDRNLIASLEADKADLRKELADLSVQRDQEVLAKQETEAELLDRQVSEARFKRITNLVNNTRVKFNKVSLSKERFGKSIGKIKKENSKWKYTVIEFFLEHEDLKLLLDEQFLVKVVNSDTGEVLSYIESNPNFPDSQIDSKGIKFKFDGNMIEVSYFNNQKKTGKNYEIQVFYLSEDEEYLLLDGAKPFIQNRKVVKS